MTSVSLMRCRGGVTRSRKDSDILLPYGEASNGRMLHISEVSSGLGCGCKCPDCAAPLVAHKGPKKEHHFAHHSGTACGISLETTLHKVAKQVIADSRQVWLPPVDATVGGEWRVRHRAQMLREVDVVLEQWLGGLRPDIIVRKGGHDLLVEVAVTHFCDEPKLALIRQRQLASIEIDLSEVPRGASREEIEDAILRSAPRHWLFNAHGDELALKMAAEQAQKAAQLAVQKERAIRSKVSGLMEVWNAAPSRVEANAGRESTAPQLAELTDARVLDAIGHDVGGDRCFTVERRMWQAVILHHIVNPKWANAPVKTTDVLKLLTDAGLVKPGLVGFISEEWSDHARGVNLDFMSPFEAVGEYLALLLERGIVRERSYGYLVADTQFVRDAHIAVKNARTSRTQVAGVRRALDSLLSAIGRSPSVNPGAWMRTRHPGLDDAPEVAAARSSAIADRLMGHLERLRRMLVGTGGVEENLLGLPLEDAREQRRAAIAADEEAARLKEEQRKAAAIARERQEAERLRDRLAFIARALLGPVEGEQFVIKPFDCLGGRSLASIDGLNEEQARVIGRALDTESHHLQWARERERAAQNRRDRLQKAAETAFGAERAAVWMKASHPALSGRRPQEVAVDDGDLERCLALLPTRGSNRR